MVRFKAIRASRLLLGVAVVLFLLVAAALCLRYFLSAGERAPAVNASLVSAESGGQAETTSVFASAGEAFSPAETAAGSGRPSVLVYHTHTHEAYEQEDADPYVAVEAWRTVDAGHSVVRVGAELSKQLRALGFDVVHDVTDNEGSDLATAYDRSLQMLQGYDRAFDLYIDLHRDACLEGEDKPAAQGARLMLLVGNGNGFDDKPYTAQNYAFAKALTGEINRIRPGLCREVLLKDGRYNQNIGVFSILVEVGHNRNTLGEALASVPPLAEAIRRLMIDAPRPELTAMRGAYLAGDVPGPGTDPVPQGG